MRVTDAERAAILYDLAEAALVTNTERRYRMPWDEVIFDGVLSSGEMRYAAHASPAFIRRLIRRAGYRPDKDWR